MCWELLKEIVYTCRVGSYVKTFLYLLSVGVYSKSGKKKKKKTREKEIFSFWVVAFSDRLSAQESTLDIINVVSLWKIFGKNTLFPILQLRKEVINSKLVFW